MDLRVLACIFVLLLAGCTSDEKAGISDEPIAGEKPDLDAEPAEPGGAPSEPDTETQRVHYNNSVADKSTFTLLKAPETGIIGCCGYMQLMTVDMDGEFVSGTGELTCTAPTDAVSEWGLHVLRGSPFSSSVDAHFGTSPMSVEFTNMQNEDAIAVSAEGVQGGGLHVDVTCSFSLTSVWDVEVAATEAE